MHDLPRVVTAGETMILGTPAQPGKLRHASNLELKIGGAESNVAIALARLGLSTGWVSNLGADELGQLVLNRIRGEGVDTSQVSMVEGLPTGLYLRERLNQTTRVYYYRSNSAAATLTPGVFDPSYLDGADILHLTGVTPALSKTCAQFVWWLIGEAQRRGLQVSFDVNYRSKLWSREEAREFIEEVLQAVDVLFVSAEEAAVLWRREDESLLQELSIRGPKDLILKRGAQGNSAYVEGEWLHQRAFEVSEVDSIGAGDAFAAGYLAGLAWGDPPERRLQLASAMGAYSVMTLGDYEGLPDYKELSSFVDGVEELGR